MHMLVTNILRAVSDVYILKTVIWVTVSVTCIDRVPYFPYPNRKDLQALTLVGPTCQNPVLDPSSCTTAWQPALYVNDCYRRVTVIYTHAKIGFVLLYQNLHVSWSHINKIDYFTVFYLVLNSPLKMQQVVLITFRCGRFWMKKNWNR